MSERKLEKETLLVSSYFRPKTHVGFTHVSLSSVCLE